MRPTRLWTPGRPFFWWERFPTATESFVPSPRGRGSGNAEHKPTPSSRRGDIAHRDAAHIGDHAQVIQRGHRRLLGAEGIGLADGAILNDLSFTRIFGGFTVRPLENLRLSASNGYFNYTDSNQRNRTEVTADYRLLNVPDSYMLNVGARFIYDDTQNRSNLFWTPNNYIGLTAPVTAKVNLADSWTGEVAVAPGIGKEAGQSFQFQINAGGVIRWNLNDDMGLYVSGNRYSGFLFKELLCFTYEIIQVIVF
jgi:hypothetical protein